MSLLTRYLPFAPGITSIQAVTYLLFVCLFSISFLVFLNSSVSFVITDLLDIKDGVGDLVGTLGFVDELVALVACPVWGIVSDRLGVKWVCALGYLIVGVSLLVFVQAKNVYPQLLVARMLFSIGGAATATMVTAILPSMTGGGRGTIIKSVGGLTQADLPENVRHSVTPSVDSEVTITPERYNRGGVRQAEREWMEGMASNKSASPPRLAGLVGLFTGCGALVALALFLPLPARFSTIEGITKGQAVADSFYVVGTIALCVAVFCFIGLGSLQGEEDKGWKTLLGRRDNSNGQAHEGDVKGVSFLPYHRLLIDSTILGFHDAQIGLGYLGGFVARASSVGISLFIPLYINAYFISHGFCKGSPTDPSPELKKECRAAYVLAAELTGASQLIALLCAPLFGWASDRYRRFNIPLLSAAICGVVGYTAFAQLQSPEIKNIDGRGGSPAIFIIVALIGISQIGAIVCSLGLLGRGVLGAELGGHHSTHPQNNHNHSYHTTNNNDTTETAPLLAQPQAEIPPSSRSHLKGSIAGVYSLSGGAAILLLTKLGGNLFDSVNTGAPFYMMAIFNAVLLVVGVGSGIYREIRLRAS